MTTTALRDRLAAARLALPAEDIEFLRGALPEIDAARVAVRSAARDLPSPGWSPQADWQRDGERR
ncbi:MAG: hypothetical protein JNK67_17370 [Alphaproteobacteria bacterium]|nr:hypothetical protein [Alphaproteobacteria bacterium]